MAHRTKINGTGYDIVGGRTRIAGTGYDILKGRTRVNGTGYDIMFGTRISELPVGSQVKMTVGGLSKRFIIVHQGNPDTALYDGSCNDTWLMMESIHKEMLWNEEGSNDYENSTIHKYMNNSSNGFLSLIDADARPFIKEVKIPYVKGPGETGSIQSGSNGLSTKVFALSAFEVGIVQHGNEWAQGLFVDGAKLDYFQYGGDVDNDPDACDLRIAKPSGHIYKWYLRSIYHEAEKGVYLISEYGNMSGWFADDDSDIGVRPALIVYGDTLVDEEGYILT